MAKQSANIALPFPREGVDENWALADQPPLTCPPTAMNVVLYGRDGRGNGAQRSGTSKYLAGQFGSGAAVLDIIQPRYVPAGGALTDYLCVVSAGHVYAGSNPASLTNLANVGGSNTLSTTVKPSSCWGMGTVMYVDGGSNIQTLDLSAMTVAPLAASAGTIPTGHTVACIWRNRLVLAGPDHTWDMSRVGCYTCWDFGQEDDARPIEGQNATAGKIGGPINCLIPWMDDILFFGGDSCIWKAVGDPAYGGTITVASDEAIGTMGPDCWAKDSEGNIWFVGTNGFYQMSPGGTILNISGKHYPTFFRSISRDTHYVIVRWDNDRYGCHIFVTAKASAASTHLWFDARGGGFWPIQYPNGHGPTAAMVWDGKAGGDRALLLGGRDGYLRKLDDAATSDDGTAITSQVDLGPVFPTDYSQMAMLQEVHAMTGALPPGFTNDSSIRCNYTIKTANDVQTALTDPRISVTGAWTGAGHQPHLHPRMTGNSFWITAGLSGSNAMDKFWSLERILLTFTLSRKSR